MPDIKVNDQQLEAQLARLEQARPWSPRVMSKLETFIRAAPDVDLFRVNPIQYALERSMTEAEAVDLFLHATKIGLFEMDWHIVCPHCGFVVDSLHTLSQLRTHYLCPICGAERDYALDDYIQVAFSISPQVRDIPYHHPESLSVEDLYLNYRLSKDVISPLPAFPAWRDAIIHVTRYLGYVQPGEIVRTAIALPPGVLRTTDGRNCLQLAATQEQQEQTSRIAIRLVDGTFQSDDPQMQPGSLTAKHAEQQLVQFRYDLQRELPSGRVVIDVENRQDRRSALCIYQPGDMPVPVLTLRPNLSGKKLLATQTFGDLFRSEIIKMDETLSIKDITFVFTDLKGSTEMYEQIGDAKAYFLVHQHFDTLRRVIRERHGAIVKTIGDAVMAVFDNPIEATTAALEMIDALTTFNHTISQELILKVGLHRGHAIAVTVNERIDYFGQNVNIAARVQALADANEVYITADVYTSPGVSDALKAYQVAPDEVLVKGVSEKLLVYKIGQHHHS
ncbi:MAG: adenylate/guanylate cyclase domain-containing protein [Chloroflexales bacterium]|nr:adenylate/guanylate cyclase domain-containing protein [Chloroflexales bacterium]